MGASHAIPSSTALAQAAFDFRAGALAISDAANVFRAGLQQTWTIGDLERRYAGHTRDQILALLSEHAGYVPARGRHLVVHLDHVLAVDAALRQEFAR